MRVGVLVKESLRAADRERFERSVRDKVESLGSSVAAASSTCPTRRTRSTAALARLTTAAGGEAVDVVLTAGGRSTDPGDPFFVALEAVGGRLIRRGVPAHPGSMLWLGPRAATRPSSACRPAAPTRRRRPRTCCCRGCSPASRRRLRTVSRLGHGGILTRDMRFRFPAYARALDAPDG